jgi:hypothetical protein
MALSVALQAHADHRQEDVKVTGRALWRHAVRRPRYDPRVSWKPITASELSALLARELKDCSAEQKAYFEGVRIPPVKWRLSPWGDEGGGFWAVAIHGSRVLWYNDIEAGFNVSRFDAEGSIPVREYWCNQDTLRWALPLLRGDPGTRMGAPRPATPY